VFYRINFNMQECIKTAETLGVDKRAEFIFLNVAVNSLFYILLFIFVSYFRSFFNI